MRRVLMAVAGLLLTMGSVILVEAPAESMTPVGTGTVQCNVTGSLTFSPPLTPNGTPGSKEVISAVLTPTPFLGNPACSGGTPAQTTASMVVKTIKIKGTGRPKLAGACFQVFETQSIALKSKISWGTPAKSTKLTVGNAVFSIAPFGVGTLSLSGTTTGSYAGSSAAGLGLNFSIAESVAIDNCIGGSSSMPISSLQVGDSQLSLP